MLQVVVGPYAHIFAFLLSRSTTLVMSRKVLALTVHIIFSGLPTMLLWRTSRKQCSMCSSGSKHTFSPSGYPKIRFLQGRGSDISMVSLALTGHIMFSGLSKMLHVLGRKTNLASGRRTFAYIFVFWLSQNTNLRGRECDYSMGSLALTWNFVLSGLSKM